MFCSNCGKEIAADDKFCMHCGAPVKEQERQQTFDNDPFFGNNHSYDGSQASNNQPYGMNDQPVRQNEKGNGMAIAGFVCSFFVPLLGWIFGGIGLNRASKRNGKGRGFSIAAIAIASVNWLLNFITMLGDVPFYW